MFLRKQIHPEAGEQQEREVGQVEGGDEAESEAMKGGREVVEQRRVEVEDRGAVSGVDIGGPAREGLPGP